MARRTKAREVAVQMLYLLDLNPDIGLSAIRDLIDESLTDEELRFFAYRCVVGVMENRPRLDDQIEATAQNWSLKRMAATDRNVLRLGLYELLHTATPHRVVLDEAVELAKLFGAAQSGPFVNGLLDKLVPPERRNEPDRREE